MANHERQHGGGESSRMLGAFYSPDGETFSPCGGFFLIMRSFFSMRFFFWACPPPPTSIAIFVGAHVVDGDINNCIEIIPNDNVNF